MTKEYNIAILGATGAVGEMIIEVLEERRDAIIEAIAYQGC